MATAAEQQVSTTGQLEGWMSALDVRAQVDRIVDIMDHVMKDGVHYGRLPGVKKPSLWQPGAHKLAMTFRMALDPAVVEDLGSPGLFRYRVRCEVKSMVTGLFLGAGLGEASTDEEKYLWEEAVCDEEWNETDAINRRTKYRRDKSDKGFVVVKQIKTSAPDKANTVLKMALKRALVGAVLAVTAASDIFCQDEDTRDEMLDAMEESFDGESANGGEKKEPREKKAQTVTMRFGRQKDKRIDDPSVPVDDLTWYLGAKRNSMSKPGREQYRADDEKEIALIEAELTKRTTKLEVTKPAEAVARRQPASDEPMIPDDEWKLWKLDMIGTYPTEYYALKAEMNIQKSAEVAPAQRREFQHRFIEGRKQAMQAAKAGGEGNV